MRKLIDKMVTLSMRYPKIIIGFILIVTGVFGYFVKDAVVDTDPENMLGKNEWVRVYHNQVKKEFAISDIIVLGVINHKNQNGVFNPETLNRVGKITEDILLLDGVIKSDVMSSTTIDDIKLEGETLVVERLMAEEVKSQEQADLIKASALDNPMLYGTLISEDEKALTVYVPIKEKKLSYKISQEIREILKKYPGEEEFHITGLPVANDTFGVEMFKQMAVSAPSAGLIVFLLMLVFFRKIVLVVSPMMVAVISIVWTMGLMIKMGFTVHIMSSMIPIFLMPISVVDSVHILSLFFDKYAGIKDKLKTVQEVIHELFWPMLYTSLTTAAGFGSLAFTPIPPVQAFGSFVAFGVLVAWFLTMFFIPAYIALIPEKSLDGFGHSEEEKPSKLADFLRALGRFSVKRNKLVLVISLIIIGISIWGITKINVNDNPVRWFAPEHEIRVADKVLNEHFSGTYMAYLTIDSKQLNKGFSKEEESAELENKWGFFKKPENLKILDELDDYIVKKGYAGKVNTIADVVKKIGYELYKKDNSKKVIPETSDAVAQYLFLYESSGDPDDLYHLVDYDYTKVNLWLQLKSGDNQQIQNVVREVEAYLKDKKFTDTVKVQWGGLTYINVEWQKKMVWGMLNSLASSFVIVFLMMVFLFRSVLFGLLSMIPLSFTITFIYGVIGIVGKDYDMPAAVLSSLTLGLSVDFAIHFIERLNELVAEKGNLQEAIEIMFDEPARAITRNAVVIAIGFLPLLLASLVPYKTVGFFLATIMAVSGLSTLVLLPTLAVTFEKWLYPKKVVVEDKVSE